MIRVRPATSADARRIADIHVASWQTTYAGVFPDEYLRGLDVRQRTRAWRRTLRSLPEAAGHVVVADCDRLCGFAHYGPSRDDDRVSSGELYAIYVDPRSAGTGAGRSLVAAGERLLAKDGYDDAIVWVLEANSSARGFYEHLGWTAESTTKQAMVAGVMVLERRHSKVLAPATEVGSST